MSFRFISLILLIMTLALSASAQVSPELVPYGLDTSDPSNLKQIIGQLDRKERLTAVDALRVLTADTTLVTRVFEHRVEKRRDTGRTVNRDHEYERAVTEAIDVRDAAQRAARRLGFIRDTGIHCAFDLPDSALAMLEDQGAAVMPWTKNEMYEWYDKEYPFVTTDLVYHTFMILVRAAFDELENLSFSEELIELTREWANACLELAEDVDPELAQLSRDNAAMLAVAMILASDGETAFIDEFGLDAVRRSHVEAEVARVREATYLGPSPLLGEDEDYTEYRARGRASGKLGTGYFMARQWLSRVVFPVGDTQATKRALLLVEALERRKETWRRWDLLDRTTAQLAGPRDDPDARMYRELAEKITGYEGLRALRAVLVDDDSFTQFKSQAARWTEPLIDDSPAVGQRSVLGLRLLSQRRSADGVLLQRLAEDSAWPISGLQVMAGLFEIPDEESLLEFCGLELPNSAAAVKADSIGLMAGYRSCHEVLFDTPEGLPALFKSRIWRDKQVNSALGAWAESRHAAAPYLKSAHVSMGLTMDKPELQGYVEPYPEFYRRLKNEARKLDILCREIGVYEAVSSHAELNPKAKRLDEGRFPEFMEILSTLEAMAVSELSGEPQTADDATFLKKLGTRLRFLCFNHSNSNVAKEPMSRIIDVATEYQSGQVLEAGVGMAHAIFVAVKHGDETVICRGSVYGYHEFIVPVQSRLDDSIWAGVSAGTVLFGIGPWLDQASHLYYRPHFSPEELEAASLTPKGRIGDWRGFPWCTMVSDHHPVAPWVGFRVRSADVGQLITIAERDDLGPDLLRFVNRELSRHGSSAPVLDYCRRVIDSVAQNDSWWRGRESDSIQLFWALQTISLYGNSGDRARLAAMEKVLDKALDKGYIQRPGFAPREPVLHWLLDVAAEHCGVGASTGSN